MIGFPRRLRDHKLILSQVHLIIVQGANFLHLADASCFVFLKYELIISCCCSAIYIYMSVKQEIVKLPVPVS